jgi:RNA polymerase sigma factor (sigma-70 family)
MPVSTHKPQSVATIDSVETLYSHHHGWLCKWLCGKLGNHYDAADVAQDTFLRVITSKSSAALLEPRGYLATIARGLMIDRFRRQAVEQAYLDALAHFPEPETISQEMHAIIIETLQAIDALLTSLGSRTRQIFLMAQIEEMTQAEIAKRLNISLPTVKKHLVRAYTECLVLAAS